MNTSKTFRLVLPFLWLHLQVSAAVPSRIEDSLSVVKTAQDSLRALCAVDSTAAHYYAPILWFESSERHYPTIPFFTAFQWQQRAEANPHADYSYLLSKNYQNELEHQILNRQKAGAFFDPQMIWPDSSWYALLKTYDAQRDSQPKPQVWVFWDKREISAKKLRSIIESDHQFRWREKVYVDHLKAMKNIDVFRYWLYYLNDTGLQGHPQDIEIMFVFVPQLQKNQKPFPEPLAIIGAGHTEMVPNNVLLVTPGVRMDSIFVMVERGGHSIAPDRNGDGRFNPGFDANWQAANLWGTRDTQAAAGLGALGNYKSWMTFPRHEADRCLPPRLKNTHPWSYELLALEDLKAAYDKIKQLPKAAMASADDSAAWHDFGRSLEKIGGPPAQAWMVISDSVRLATRERLQYWLEDQWTYELNMQTGKLEEKTPGGLKDRKHMPWKHRYFDSSPNAGFKRHLFPPRGFPDQLLRGIYIRSAGKREVVVGIDLLVAELPIMQKLLKFPGTIVLDTGIRNVEAEPNQIAARLLYDTRYATVFSGYFGWGFQADWKQNAFKSHNTQKFFYGGLKAEYYWGSMPLSLNFVQIRAGVRIRNKGQQLLFRDDETRFELQFGFHR